MTTSLVEEFGPLTLTHYAMKLGVAALLALMAAACTSDSSMNSNPALPDDAPRVVIETSLGDIVIGLYEEQSPLTVANFLAYVDAGFFDGTAFHRVIPGFMIQGGGWVPQGGGAFQSKDRLPPIVLESDNGLKNLRGTVTMARLDVPSDSATSEFFINLLDNQRLDRLGDVQLGYAVFGAVLEGMDIVEAIAVVPTQVVLTFPNERATPVEDVIIRSVRRQD